MPSSDGAREAGVVERDEEEELKPYTTDLEYLQDQFRLVKVLIQAAKARKNKDIRLGA